MQNEGHFVYLYRDKRGNPIYVGRGEHSSRSNAHATSGAHNDALSALLLEKRHTVEIAGPFGSVDAAAFVEAALISTLSGTPRLRDYLTNKNDGDSRGRFRPSGVPLAMADRVTSPALMRSELEKLSESSGPLLFVYVNARDFSDGRKGFDVAQIPSDHQIAERMEKYWQLQRRLREWSIRPEESPKVLIGVSGPIENRLIIGASPILTNKDGSWRTDDSMLHDKGRITVPIEKSAGLNLDFLNLRGRRIDLAAELKFNSFAQEQYIILTSSGRPRSAITRTKRK